MKCKICKEEMKSCMDGDYCFWYCEQCELEIPIIEG